MVELEGELQHLEGHIAKIRAEAKRRFLKAGIPKLGQRPFIPGLKGKRKPSPLPRAAGVCFWTVGKRQCPNRRPALHAWRISPTKSLISLYRAIAAWNLHCRMLPNSMRRFIAMKTHKGGIVIQRLDERRCVIAVDGVVRYVGTQEECERRAAILAPKNDRAAQDRALARLGCLMR
jgi:hypothetical protein